MGGSRGRDVLDPRGFAALIAAYLAWNQAAKGFTERTLEGRRRAIGYFIDWCEERSVYRPAEVTKPILERYQRWLFHYRKENGNPLGTTTQYQRLCMLRGFFKWLTRENYILSNPASELDLPKQPKRLPRYVLTESEVERVLAEPDLRTLQGIRDRAILETLYSTGVRRLELVSMLVSAVDFERAVVLVREGKGRKDRVLPIGERALSWIGRYLNDVRPEHLVEPDDGKLFLSRLGAGMTEDYLSQMARNYLTDAGLTKAGACHLFRHSMATAMLENGADIRYIQQMLGHTQLTSTQLYTQVSIRKLQEIHRATHPTAKLERKSSAAPEQEDEEDAEDLLSSLAAEDDEAGDDV